MTTMDENVKLTHLLSKISLNLKAPLVPSTFHCKKLIAFLDVHNREK
jgi:hypothetical protein